MIKEKTKTNKLAKGSALALAATFAAAGLPAVSLGAPSFAYTGDTTMYILQAAETVDVGSTYTIRTAFFGDHIPVGLESYDGYEDVTASSVKVTYLSTGRAIDVTYDGDTDVKGEMAGAASDMTYGTFVADGIGSYQITYSITVDGKVYNKDLIVRTKEASAVVTLQDSNVVLPKVYDLSYDKVKDGDNFKNVNLPLPSVYLNNEDDARDIKVYTKGETVDGAATEYVVVSVSGPKAVAINKNETAGKVTDLYIDGNALAEGEKVGEYIVSYDYYQKEAGHSAIFVGSTTMSFTVKKGYYVSDYGLIANKGKDMTFVTGTENDVYSPVVSSEFYKSETDSANNNKTTESLEKLGNLNYYKFDATVKFWNGLEWVETTNKVVDGKYVPAEDGKYRVGYTVTDFYGNTASLKQDIEVTSADTQKPEVFMYDASQASEDYVDASNKLISKTNENNIVIYAIGAKDNVTALSDMKLTRTITSATYATIEIKEYNNYNLIFNYDFESTQTGKDLLSRTLQEAGKTTQADVDAWLKANKFLKVVTSYSGFNAQLQAKNIVTDSTAENFDLDAIKTELVNMGYAYLNLTTTISTSGTTNYNVVYSAEDKAGNNISTEKYAISVVSSAVTTTSIPEVKVSTTFKAGYGKNEKITFSAPTATDEDTRMEVVTTYYYKTATKYLNAEAAEVDTLAEAKVYALPVDGKYEIDLSKAPANASKVVIVAKAENDFGNIGTYEKTLSITSIADTVAPTVAAPVWAEAPAQYEEINLPVVTFTDDYVANIKGKVEIYRLGDTKEDVNYKNYSTTYNPIAGTYTLSAGKFAPMEAGTYEIVISAVDPANNIVSTYYFFTATPVAATSEIKVGAVKAINGDNTVTVGETFSFATPTISASLAEGKTFVDTLLDEDQKTAKYFTIEVVERAGDVQVGEDPTQYTVSAAGTYKFKYKVYYKLNGDADYTVIESDVIVVTAKASTESKTFSINWEEGVYDKKVYNKGDKINVYSVGGDSDIDAEKSYISINRSGPSNGYEEIKLSEFGTSNSKEVTLSGNGTYTITYNIMDRNGNKYTCSNGETSYALSVGDTERPEISFESGFVEDEYVLGSDPIELDLSKLTLGDNITTREKLLETLTVTLQRQDDDGNWITVDNIGDASNDIYKYNLDNVGEYKFTFYVKDEANWSKTETKTFTVKAEGSQAASASSTKVVGIVLIVLACLILVGVIAYFVISRIKMNKKSALAKKTGKSNK